MLTYISNTEELSSIIQLGSELFNQNKEFTEKTLCMEFDTTNNSIIIANLKNMITNIRDSQKKENKLGFVFLESHIIPKLSLLTNYLTESNSFTDTSQKLFDLCVLICKTFEIDFYELIYFCYFSAGKALKFKSRFLENLLSIVELNNEQNSSKSEFTISPSKDIKQYFEQIIEDSIISILNEIDSKSVEIIIQYCFAHYSMTKSLKLISKIDYIIKESRLINKNDNNTWFNKAKFAFFDNTGVDLTKLFKEVKSNKQNLPNEALVVDLVENNDFKGLINLDFIGINNYRYLTIYNLIKNQEKRQFTFEEISSILKVSKIRYFNYSVILKQMKM
jgi:hypothetical protein